MPLDTMSCFQLASGIGLELSWNWNWQQASVVYMCSQGMLASLSLQEDHTTKQMLEQFADLAGKKVHVEKRSLVGAQLEAFAAAVRQDDVHLLAIAVRLAPTHISGLISTYVPECLV